MNKRYHELLREEFEKEMAAKTGWGRNDIMAAFDRAAAKAALRILDEKEN